MAIEEGAFADRGIDLLWTDVPQGTGRMVQMLDEGEADLAVVLTEGAIKSICDGLPLRILQSYETWRQRENLAITQEGQVIQH